MPGAGYGDWIAIELIDGPQNGYHKCGNLDSGNIQFQQD